jgi:hypothetical protein
MGVSLSAGSIAAILSGCEVDHSDDWTPGFFTKAQADFILEIGETLLPRTSTPGAKDALVVRYLDTIRPLRYTSEDNDQYKEKINAFIEQTRADLGGDFIKSDPEVRLAWLTDLDKRSFEAVRDNPELTGDKRPFYLTLKEQILGGYFSSEIVAKEYFAFDPVPGRYDACVPYEEIGRAWAL